METVIEPARTEEKEKRRRYQRKPWKSNLQGKNIKSTSALWLLNDTNPLWNKHPNECSEEDYKSFYRKVFRDYKEPLFWIHLNMDYPFNLKGHPVLPENQYGV